MSESKDFICAGNCTACGTGKIELQVWFVSPPFSGRTRIGPGLNPKRRMTKFACRDCGLIYDKIAPRSKLFEHQLDRIQRAAKSDCQICFGFGYCRVEKQEGIIACPECLPKKFEPRKKPIRDDSPHPELDL